MAVAISNVRLNRIASADRRLRKTPYGAEESLTFLAMIS